MKLCQKPRENARMFWLHFDWWERLYVFVFAKPSDHDSLVFQRKSYARAEDEFSLGYHSEPPHFSLIAWSALAN